DQEEARRLQAQFDEEDRAAREKAAKEELENLALFKLNERMFKSKLKQTINMLKDYKLKKERI
ncbi:hypothetical protein Tco_0495255, partial [Tanacetum coccineum]